MLKEYLLKVSVVVAAPVLVVVVLFLLAAVAMPVALRTRLKLLTTVISLPVVSVRKESLSKV